jgi:hypothetical protein
LLRGLLFCKPRIMCVQKLIVNCQGCQGLLYIEPR